MPHSKLISAIDIGTSKITTIVGQHFEPENKLNVIAVSSVPASGFRKGQIINLEQASQTLVQGIESAERMAGFNINSAYVSLLTPHIESLNSHGVVATSNPGNEISYNDISRVIEAARAISLPSGKEIIHIIPRVYTVDGQDGIIDPVGMNGVRLEIEAHVLLASTPSLKNLKKCLDDIGINIQSLVYSGLASAKASLTETEKELGVALIDIGSSLTSVTIFTEGSPAYAAVVPIGANNITNDLAIGLRFSLENAEKIKLGLSRLNKNLNKFEDEIETSQFATTGEDQHRKISLQTTVNGIIKPRLEEIFSLVNQQIQNSGLSQNIPSGLVLTGGGSQTIQASNICENVIPLPLRTAQPPKIGGIVDDILNPAYASTIGLLLYALEDNPPKTSRPPSKISVNNFISKVKNFLEPLLP